MQLTQAIVMDRQTAGQTAGGCTLGWWMGDSYSKPVGRLLQ